MTASAGRVRDIMQNWRGRPLENLETIVRPIGNTTTDKGLRIKALLDRQRYGEDLSVSDRQLDGVLSLDIPR